MHYIKLRKSYEFLFYFAALVVIIVSVALWKNSIFYIIPIIFVLTVFESILVKCPNCGRRPVRLLKRFPHQCPHCEYNF